MIIIESSKARSAVNAVPIKKKWGHLVRNIFISLVFSVLCGCAPIVHTQITAFHELPSNTNGMKFTVIPLKDQVESVEYRSYARLIKDAFYRHGFVETPIEHSDLILFFAYGVSDGKDIMFSYPLLGQVGISSSSTVGVVKNLGGVTTISTVTQNTPSIGLVGSGILQQTEYKRTLKIELVDAQSYINGGMKKIYESRIISNGTHDDIAVVMRTMIKELFDEFPGKSGQVQTKFFSLVSD